MHLKSMQQYTKDINQCEADHTIIAELGQAVELDQLLQHAYN